ncbi:hypothetical protein [Celeribacter halophilus]|uniref:Uncharacterized protein n=1 Tax=Celeribacter halophilus TaxID=576117 RepID=A0A1I3RF55_9RHOB|nr:hypothetical protein [Celeribacter halophilus]PZX12570.1 hypothetical protein LX82_01311 [Celeribacter halophilus]SFJ45264.1 hypothetical protein SAMN04488138_10573 [Celeribacter halophilus]
MTKTAVRFAILLTIIWVAFWIFTIAIEWQNFKTLSFNEVGDFMAGAFGPVAFLWLVLGFFQQGEELKNSVEALNLQTRELKQSVKHQNDLAISSQENLLAQLDMENARIWRDIVALDIQARSDLREAKSAAERLKLIYQENGQDALATEANNLASYLPRIVSKLDALQINQQPNVHPDMIVAIHDVSIAAMRYREKTEKMLSRARKI